VTRRRKPIPPDPNPFIRKHLERQVAEMLAAEGMVPIDVKNLPKVHSSKPSPASTPRAGRADSMEIRASIRKHEAFIAKKHRQRQERNQQ
jgi:hypothetical protein